MSIWANKLSSLRCSNWQDPANDVSRAHCFKISLPCLTFHRFTQQEHKAPMTNPLHNYIQEPGRKYGITQNFFLLPALPRPMATENATKGGFIHLNRKKYWTCSISPLPWANMRFEWIDRDLFKDGDSSTSRRFVTGRGTDMCTRLHRKTKYTIQSIRHHFELKQQWLTSDPKKDCWQQCRTHRTLYDWDAEDFSGKKSWVLADDEQKP